ncbi:unnamed protein product [Echinostoma caproni]|uniref:Ras-GEF domain-containing protein n=1 Tax=Echinostoma caproni TaxID=27848 RepID=A0A183BCX9_9TREM|nr:unnamed protein product [Echinostoma caproni]
MAVVSGLLVQSVYRLSATWAALSSRDRSAFRKLADLFSQDQNFVNLRTAIDTARLPCIPYLGECQSIYFHSFIPCLRQVDDLPMLIVTQINARTDCLRNVECTIIKLRGIILFVQPTI